MYEPNRKIIGTVARVWFELFCSSECLKGFIVILNVIGSGVNFDKNVHIWFKNKMFNFYWLCIIDSIYPQKELFWSVHSQETLAKRSLYLLMEEAKKRYGESNVSFSENLFLGKKMTNLTNTVLKRTNKEEYGRTGGNRGGGGFHNVSRVPPPPPRSSFQVILSPGARGAHPLYFCFSCCATWNFPSCAPFHPPKYFPL